MSKSKFMPHIQGMRAIAILLVLAGHMNVPGLQGGFLGVDVFFVISGFLITGLLYDEYELSRDPVTRQGHISLRGFYTRRARRILPASAVTIVLTLVVSYFISNQADFQQFATDGVFAFLFLANVHFAQVGTDYFQQAAASSPFQHFWSLSVEEQFYLFWPVILIAALSFQALKFRNRTVSWQTRLLWAIASLLVISLFFGLYYSQAHNLLSYFSTTTRVWELAAGGVFAVLLKSQNMNWVLRPWAGAAGLALIAGSVLIAREDSYFVATIPTVVGSLLLISSQHPKDLIKVALSTRFFSFLGLISYSLYLWHWPVIVLFTDLLEEFTIQGAALALLLSLALAVISYYLIEKPFLAQRPNTKSLNSSPNYYKSRIRNIISAFSISLAVLIGPMVYIQSAPALSQVFQNLQTPIQDKAVNDTDSTEVLPDSQSTAVSLSVRFQEIEKALKIKNHKLSRYEEASLTKALADNTVWREAVFWTCESDGLTCEIGNPESPNKYLVLGDSHAAQWKGALARVVKAKKDMYFKLVWAPTCPNAKNLDAFRTQPKPEMPTNAECSQFHQKAVGVANSSNWNRVFLADNSHEGTAYVRGAIEFIKDIERKVVIVEDPPSFFNLKKCLNRDYSNTTDCTYRMKPSTIDAQVAQRSGVEFLKVWDLFCVEDECPVFIGEIATAFGHLNAAASWDVGPYLWLRFEELSVPSK